jgi:hypothetical protein
LDTAFQVADERTIKPGLHMQFHLRYAALLSNCPHYFPKRLFYSRAGLKLLSTFGHLEENMVRRLSAIGQRAVTDNDWQIKQFESERLKGTRESGGR